jgi:hypothetical protein
MRASRLSLLALGVAALIGVTARDGRAVDFKTGEMIDKDNWQKAEGLLPPEILRHYKEASTPTIHDWPVTQFNNRPTSRRLRRERRKFDI